MNTNIDSLYDFALQQMAAESYFENSQSWGDPVEVTRLLQLGTNREDFTNPTSPNGYPGLTRMTAAQADEFVSKFTIIHQWSDNPTILNGTPAPRPAAPGDAGYLALNGQQILANTGLSATLIRSNETGQYTLAIRSTEYRNWSDGGDGERDKAGADIYGIAPNGFAFAQLDALEYYYAWLKGPGGLPADATLNVSGYSLGGQLATVFTEIHRAEMNGGETVTFNGAGRGSIGAGGSLQQMLAFYRQALINPASTPEGLGDDDARMRNEAVARAGQAFDPLTIYADPRYLWAVRATSTAFSTFFGGFADEYRTGTGADDIITQVWGREFNDNNNMTANSGIHGPALGVFIESQPLLQGLPGAADFANGHSIVLIADTLALMRSIELLDPAAQITDLNGIFSAASNLRAASAVTGTGQNAAYEYDALENVLDGLRRLFLGKDITPTAYTEGGSGFADLTKRNGFYANLAALQESAPFQTLQSVLRIVDAPTDGLAAKDDFCALLSLTFLTPFGIQAIGDSAFEALKTIHPTLATQWEADKALTPEQRDQGMANISDQYLTDRADFLRRKNFYNERNASYDSTGPNAFGTEAAANPEFDAEDIVWTDRQSEAKIQRGILTDSTRYVVFGGDQNETDVTGAGGNDSLYGGGGNDTVKGLDGDDEIEGNAGNDSLEGGEGADRLVGGAGADTLVGGEDHDFLLGGAGNDTYYFEGSIGLDIVRDVDGRIVVGSADAEPLSGGKKLAENVWISDDKKFTYALVEGNLIIRPASDSGATGILTIQDWTNGSLGITLSNEPAASVTPSTVLIGDFVKRMNEAETKYILGPDGNYQSVGPAPGALDLIKAVNGAAWIQGLGGQDALFGGNGNDLLEGGDGGDVLFGSMGSDTLRGGSGIDFLMGSDKGSTIYPIDRQAPPAGALSDTWIPGFNWVWFRAGTYSGDFPRWAYSASEQELTIVEQSGDANNVIEGGAGNDMVWAGSGSDVVHGDGDVDVIWGMGGSDILFGDGGGDAVAGNSGLDVIAGGEGNDLLLGYGNDDAVYGGVGNDTLYGDDRPTESTSGSGSDYLDGGAGDDELHGSDGGDILIGGAGNDMLIGGAGKDIYIINRGEGSDTIVDTKADNNIFRFGVGVSKDDINLRLGSLLLDLGGGDQIHIGGFDPNDALNSVSIDSFEFADGSVLSAADLLARGFDLDGTAGDDAIAGTSVTDRIHGLGGNDLLAGFAGDDSLDGAQGNDELQGGEGDDTLVGGEGADRLFGQAGNDVLIGGDANDILVADGGSDTMEGGDGDDIYGVNAGATHVTVNDDGGNDIIVFGQGIGPDQVMGGTTSAGGQSITFAGGLTVEVSGAVDHYEFADGRLIGPGEMAHLIELGNQAPQAVQFGTTIVNHLVNGAFDHSTVTVVDASGTDVSYYSGENGTGDRLRHVWSTVAGGSGDETFNANGSSYGTETRLDGSYTSYTDNGQGTRLEETFNSEGVRTGDEWTEPDGTHGDNTYFQGGGGSGHTYLNGVLVSSYFNDGHGTIESRDGNGNLIRVGAGETARTYPNTTDTMFGDGSHRVTIENGPGESTSTLYGANGARLGTSWAQPDGSHGFELFHTNGSSDGAVYQADGAYQTFAKNGMGQTIARDYTPQGLLLGSEITELNGLNSITTFTNAAGVKIRETWLHADGTTGTNLISSQDFNGLSNAIAVLAGRGLPENRQWWTSADGYAGGYAFQDDGAQYATEWYIEGAEPGGISSAWSHLNTGIWYDSAFHQWWYMTDVYKPGSTTVELFKFEEVGMYERSFALQDRSWEGGVPVTGYYELIDYTSRLRLYAMASATGTKYITTSPWSTTGTAVGTIQTPVTRTFTGYGGSYNLFQDDGQGNVLLTGYTANHVRYGDMWFHNDGSHGVDVYNADGSSTGVTSNPQGSLFSFSIDAQGEVTSTPYPGIGFVIHTPPPAPPPQITPPPRPPSIGAPGGGTGRSVNTSYELTDGTVRITSAPIGNGCDEIVTRYNEQGRVISRSVIHTDPGYDAAVAYGAGFAGWTYDDTGLPIARYVDDGQGTVESWSYDAQRRVTGRSVAVIETDGSVRTTKYDAAGQLLGFTVQTTPAFGHTSTDVYDAAGRLSGRSEEASDGNGNSILSNYDAAGMLLSSTAEVVGAGGYESTFSNYDANGVSTGTIITKTSLAGVVETHNYDAAGRLTGSVVASPDSAGNVRTINYDAAGTITSFVTLLVDANGSTVITTYDADARKVREDILQISGVHSSTEYNLDGSREKTTVAVDGTFSTVLTDEHGDHITTQYSADGRKLSDTWSRGDGSHGSDTFNEDGSSTGSISYADGTSGSLVTNAAGDLTTTHRAANGAVLDAVVTTHSLNETRSTKYNPQGTLLSEEWWRVDGTRGSKVWNTDGSSSATNFRADGSYEQVSDNGQGTSTVRHYSAAGLLLDTLINHAPVAGALAAATVSTGSDFSYAISPTAFTDSDPGDLLTYIATQASGQPLPAWLTFDAATRAFSGLPSALDMGSLTLKVVATDTRGATASATFGLTVSAGRVQPPVMTAQAATEDLGWNFVVPAFTDSVAGETLSYTARLADGNSLPSWLSFDPTTRTFSGTPLNGDVGGLTLKVTATDSTGAKASATFGMTVANTNDAPTGDVTIGGTPEVGQMLTAASTLADVDGMGTLWYQWKANGTSIAGATGASLLLTQGQAGKAISVVVRYTDSRGTIESVASAATAAVIHANHAPVVTQAIAAQSATEDAAWSFTVPAATFSDTDVGDALTYTATLSDGSPLPAGLLFDATTRTFSATPRNEDVGTHGLKVTATDSAGASASTSFDLNVVNTNDAPAVVQTIAAQSAVEDVAWSFTVPAATFSDVDAGDTLTYAATLSDGSPLPAALSFDAATRTFSATPANENVGTYDLKVTATDAAGASASTVFSVNVVNINDAPTPVGTLAGWTAMAGNATGYTVPANVFADVDVGDTLTYTATLSTGAPLPSWLTFDSGSRTFSGTPATTDGGDLTLKVIATDGGGLSAYQSIALHVESDVNLTGTSANDLLVSNAGNDTLDGLAGADTMRGGAGNDVYTVDNSGDMVTEYLNEGVDAVNSSITYTLPANVEKLILTGTGNRAGTGNDLDNVLMGNSGANLLAGGAGNDTLDGGGGNDTLKGGAGNDLYVEGVSSIDIDELAGEGIDTLYSAGDAMLSANVENLVLTGAGDLKGSGNSQDNIVTGNSGNNKLKGHNGDDTLDGGAGSDSLYGGGGDDTFMLARGYGTDKIFGEDNTGDSNDIAQFASDIAANQLWFRRTDGADLEVTVIGTGDKFQIVDWFSGNQHHVAQFKSGDGKTLLDSQVQNLVQAMASFAPPAAGQTTLPQDYQSALGGVIAANWQ